MLKHGWSQWGSSWIIHITGRKQNTSVKTDSNHQAVMAFKLWFLVDPCSSTMIPPLWLASQWQLSTWPCGSQFSYRRQMQEFLVDHPEGVVGRHCSSWRGRPEHWAVAHGFSERGWASQWPNDHPISGTNRCWPCWLKSSIPRWTSDALCHNSSLDTSGKRSNRRYLIPPKIGKHASKYT